MKLAEETLVVDVVQAVLVRMGAASALVTVAEHQEVVSVVLIAINFHS
jgi:hypothetical protein